MSRQLVLSVLVLLSGSTVQAQIVSGRLQIVLPQPATSGTVSNAVGAAKTEDAEAVNAKNTNEAEADPQAAAAKQQRLEKLKQLQFDRRPSAMLKAWSNPEPDNAEAKSGEGEESENKADDEDKDSEDPNAENSEDDDDKQDAKPNDGDEADEQEEDDAKEDEEKPLTDEQKAAKKEADKAKALAKEAELFDKRLKKLQRDVTLGQWNLVKEFYATLEEDEAKAGYTRLLDALRSSPKNQGNVDMDALAQAVFNSADPVAARSMLAAGGKGPGAAMKEQNVLAFDDFIGLVDAAPIELDQDTVAKLGMLLVKIVAAGHDVDALLTMLAEAKDSEEQPLLDDRQTARLLVAAGEEVRAGKYLPDLKKAEADDDREALNLLARHFMAQYAKDKKVEQLEQAWHAVQAVLAVGEVEEKVKEEALKRAVDLAPRISEELGQAWLDESFTNRIERGQEILATIGSAVATSLPAQPGNPDYRLNALRLQKTAVDGLLRAAPDTARQWRNALDLLAKNWLKEAALTYQLDQRSHMGPQWQRDSYGNYFYMEDENMARQMRFRRGGLQPVPTGELMETRPDEAWLALIDESLRPQFAMTFSQLYLKVNEEAEAFPYIEELAVTHQEKARALAEEFLRVWTRNHDPNQESSRSRAYMYVWGYQQRAEQIPLTRSKQQRNLKELSQWVQRLRALDIGELDEELLTQAFTTSHSKAEVYRLEAIEEVFGSIDTLKPKTLAALIQQMRANLSTVWRQPDVQKKAKTNRKQKDIEAEIRQGYDVARTVIHRALEQHPGHWALLTAEASVMHDANDFQQTIAKSSEFSERRAAAMERFREATARYAQDVTALSEDEETTDVFERWFHASLGAVDLGLISEDKVADPKQPPKIREALLALPGEAADRHMGRFANRLFTRLSSVKAELKFRYLRAGFEIVGDHKQAREARKVFDYYNDLVTEIRLETNIDGSDAVGHGQPFGVYVNLVHTKEIERESGGFGRYLQNQNNQYYSYNYGRPTENYRDKFQEAATQALEEHFEVLSVTFNHPDANSKSLPKYGWRVTPYAYVLLKARGPEVDTIPSLRLDLDFLDTSGYAIIPVESAAVPIDATTEEATTRPSAEIAITQTLDERQADEGKLVLEVKATAHGLVPDLDELLDLTTPGFKIVDVENDEVSVSEFAKEADTTTVTSERMWTVEMRATTDGEHRPKEFAFGTPKVETTESIYQRYVDADLVSVDRVADLEAQYAAPASQWPWIAAGAGVLVAVLGGLLIWRRQKPVATEELAFQVPTEVTPFTVIGLLRKIQNNNGLSEASQHELIESIDRIERHYFVLPETQAIDLHQIAESWVNRAG